MRKKRRDNAKGSLEPQTELSGWNCLPNDLLVNIFRRLNHKEVFWTISSVCRFWQLACWDVLFWQGDMLDLGDLKSLCDTDDVEVEDKFDKMGLALTRVMKSLFDYHGNILEDIPRNSYRMTFPLIQPLDKHLVYVAERTTKLEYVILNMDGITGKGFSRAIRNWRELEVIAMASPGDHHYTHIIQEIGINCWKLRILTIHSISVLDSSWFRLDEYNSEVMATNLQSLRGLLLSNCYIHKFGLQTIMSKCGQLVLLELSTCRRAAEEAKLTRRRRALDAKDSGLIPEPISVMLEKSKCGGNEWLIDELAGRHNIKSVINHIWMETGDGNSTPDE